MFSLGLIYPSFVLLFIGLVWLIGKIAHATIIIHHLKLIPHIKYNEFSIYKCIISFTFLLQAHIFCVSQMYEIEVIMFYLSEINKSIAFARQSYINLS